MNCSMLRACSVCDSTKHNVIYSQHFSGIPGGSLLQGYEVVICDNCGFCFAQNIPEQKTLDEYYRNLSKYEVHEKNSPVSRFSINHFTQSSSWLSRHVAEKDIKTIDIGCSTGGFLHALKLQGYSNLQGLDPSPACARLVSELYSIPCMVGSLFDFPAKPGEYGLITFCSVLEHIRELGAALTRIWEILAPGGYVYIEIPDLTKFSEENDSPFQEFSIEHINFFSPVSLTNLLAVNGFLKVQISQSALEVGVGKTDYKMDTLFQKVKRPETLEYQFDHESEPSLRAYIHRSQEMERAISETIEGIAAEGSPILVWGTGTHTQHLLACSNLIKANIIAFIDSNPHYQGKTLRGIPILSPGDIKNYPFPILVSTRGFQYEILGIIKNELKLRNQVILLYPIPTLD